MDELILTYDGSPEAQNCLIGLANVALEFNGGPVRLEILCINEKTRTGQQNRAMHKWMGLLAEVLNAAGLEQRAIIQDMKAGFDLPWTTQSVKEWLYRPVQKAMTKKESTTELDTVEPSKICDVVGRYLAEKYGITPPAFPSIDTQRTESRKAA